uniref:Serine aminopeptidase S33 domain-containing protein n=1 Tax=Salix viminalis TaxID=40686 RepID=A0A6N2KEI3_SALVM
MKAKTPLALTSINNIIKNPLMLMIKYRPFPCPPPSSPISSIRSSCCLRSRIRSLPPSLVIEETSPVSDIDIETDSQSVSRRLILLRHAKSSWDDRSLRDHDRPLSKSGELDAAKVSQKLQQLDWIPQLILSSDALRTKETLRIMQQQVPDFLDAEVHFISSFYSIAAMDGQTADHLQQTICNYSRDGILTVMCMGHNRGWEEAASMFSGASIELKTCNAALLEAPGKSWEEAFASAGLGGWKFQGMLCLSVLSLHQRPNHNPYTPPPPVSGNDSTTTHTASNESQTRTRSLTLKKKDNPENWYELSNARGHTLRCSHYLPSPFPQDTPLPCVIYCHGNSGCRADANEAAVILLPSNITVFTLDFSGSGLSDGDYVSLGWHERDDLKVVVSYLRSNKQISCIGLWGRSMGAVTSLLYGAEDPSIAGMVLDSAFANLFDLMMELVDVYKIRLPKFTVKMAVQYMRRVIQKKAKFDIMDLNCLKVAPKTFIPALFGHASEDKFIQPHHADLIFKSYAGDKNMIKFDGDHNSSRPQFYYDSVSIFFFNVLHPPQTSTSSNKLEKYYDLGDLKVSAGMDEILLYEIITGQRSACTDAASSSSVPPSIPTKKPVSKLLYEIAPFANVVGKSNGQSEECCSYTSSNRESWGRCSSLGGSDEECPAECRAVDNSHEMTLKAFATPLRSIQQKSPDPTKEEEKKKKKKALTVPKKLKGEKFEKLEAFSKRLRHCILRRGNHQRHCSS